MSNVTLKSMTKKEASAETPAFDNKVFEMVQRAIQENANAIIANALAHGIEASQALVDEVKEQLADISSGAVKIMAVQVNESEIKNLSTEAVPYLARMIANAKVGINTLLVGPAGCGKTHAAGQLAEALGLEFGHLNLTAGASETWLFGRQTPNGFVEGTFSKLYKNGGVFLADEIDAADANLMLCINSAIAGHSLYNPISGETIQRHKDFVFVGAANTYGKGGDHRYTGRVRLDASTLDRFVAIKVDYSQKIEEALCPDDTLRTTLWEMRRKLIDLGAQEFISTRAIQVAYKQLSAGVTVKEIIESITLSWAEDLRAQVVPSKVPAAPKVEKKGKGGKHEIPF